MRLYLLLPFLLLFAFAEAQQESPYWVFIKPEAADLSDNKSAVTVIQSLEKTGFRKRFLNRWLNAVSGYASPDALAQLANLPFVKDLQPVGVYKKTVPAPPLPLAKPSMTQDAVYGNSRDPLRLIQASRLDSLGILQRQNAGKGIRMALFDSGFKTKHEVFAHFTDSTIIAKRDYVAHMADTTIPFDTSVADDTLDYPGQENHGTSVLSLIAAWKPGTMMGVAPFAQFALVKTERTKDLQGRETETVQEEDAWAAAIEWVVDTVKVDIITTSLGYRYDFTDGHGSTDNSTSYPLDLLDGHTLIITQMANLAEDRGVVVFASVGNEGYLGPSSLSAPADGDSVIAVGATDVFGGIWSGTSYGPTADGRRKPDLSAPGANIFVAEADGGYSYGSGTSFAAPMAAGGCALLFQLDTTLKGRPGKVMERLKASTYFPATVPDAMRSDPRYGTGIINIYAAYLNTRMDYTFVPLNLRIAPQPAHTADRMIFYLDVPGETGITADKIRCAIKIYTLAGKLLLAMTPSISIGQNLIHWSLVNEKNQPVGSGIYLATVDYSDNNQTQSWQQKIAVIP